MNYRRLTTSLIIVLCYFGTTAANAVVVTMDYVRSTPFALEAITVDQNTGVYYKRRGFQGEQVVDVYNNRADFEANLIDHTLNFNSPTFFGSYSSVRDGNMYGRAASMNTQYGRWDMNTLNLTATTSLNAYNPANTTGTFDWGGYSALNTLSNETSTYVMSRELGSNDWRIEQIDDNLNNTLVGHVSAHPFGFAFLIGNSVYFGDTFNSGQISTKFDLASGIQSAVDFTLDIGGQRHWWYSMTYDASTDALMAYNLDNRSYYRVENASSAFSAFSVPEPGTLGLLMTGIAALRFARRKFNRVSLNT